MANRTNVRTIYQPINSQKYNGRYPIVLKSSWEVEFAKRDCDLNSMCLKWAYEPPCGITYFDPITKTTKPYNPDFLVTYLTPSRKVKTALIEIKPMHETLTAHVRNKADYLTRARNMAKWKAAMLWCARHPNTFFTVLTEANIFAGASESHTPKRAYKGK